MWPTMLKLITSLLLGVALLAQTPAPDEPYPGQSQHQKPPDGWYCSRDALDKAHFCFCTGMQQNEKCHKKPAEPVEPDEDGYAPDPNVPPEDPTCTVWCHRSHCHCQQFCDT